MGALGQLFSLALRNVLRNRARSALTLGAIAFEVTMAVVLGGFSRGVTRVMEDDTIKGRTGALQVHRQGYFDVKENQPLKLSIDAPGDVERLILGTEGVESVTPRIFFAGLLSNGRNLTSVIVQSVDPVREAVVLPYKTGDISGSAVTPEVPNGALLVQELARAMKAVPGDTLTLQSTSPEGRQNALDLKVVGTINNSNAVEPKKVLYVPLPFAQRLLGMDGKVTEYVIAVKDRSQLTAVRRRLLAALGPGYEVQTWREVRPQLADVINFQETVLTAVSVIFLVLATFGVINTMRMAVMERTREIGTMLAVGMRRRQVGALFLAEALWLAVMGSAAGAALGLLVVTLVAAGGGIPSGAPGSTMVNYVVPEAPLELLAAAVLAASLGAVLAAVLPARQAARLNPVDALRAT